MKTLREQLLETLPSSYDPDNDGFQMLLELAVPFEIPAKEALMNPGRPFDKIYFITDGMIRVYTIYKEIDYTIDFYVKGKFILDWKGGNEQIESAYYYESLFPTKGWYWNREEFVKLMQDHSSCLITRRFFAESLYLQQVDRLLTFQSENLKEKYLHLLKNHGDLINIVPQYYIASYLGVKPQSLSRIKRNLLKTKDEGINQ